jgi:hydrogenase-4 component F
MTSGTLLIGALLALPLLGICACLLRLKSLALLRISAIVAGLECMAVAIIFFMSPQMARIYGFDKLFFIDTLSFYHLCLVALIFFFSSVYSLSYFAEEIESGAFSPKRARRFAMIWNGFLAVLLAVLCSNNMGILWICLEATTLISALLILTDGKPASIEAMWKYLLLCSVGIAFAFVGTLLLSVAAHNASVGDHDVLLWTSLYDHDAACLNGNVMLAAFIFILVGFGTKAGLAPMHTWLPDAHSQAPTPVSAVFSGIMLNCALYCIMRYLPLCEAAMGWSGRPHAMLVMFGLFSIIIAAVFIPAQKNIKRLLAYHSVEHIGIIALGLGIGGVGTFAALFHTLNHSISKTLAFFSAGRLARQFGTYDMNRMRGAVASNTLWGGAFFVSILTLLGVAPFSIFMSEFQLVKAAVDQARFVPLAIFFFGSIAVFLSALKHAIDVSWGPRVDALPRPRWFGRDLFLVAVCGALLLVVGLYMPPWYVDLLKTAAAIIEGPYAIQDYAGGLFK